MADKPLDLDAAIVSAQSSLTLGEGNRGKNKIVIALANRADEPVAFSGFGNRGRLAVTVSIGPGTEELVRTVEESVAVEFDAPGGWHAQPYKQMAHQANYIFRLPGDVFKPRESKTIALKNFACCTDPGRAQIKIGFDIAGYAAFETTLDMEKKAAAFELLYFEAAPPYIATSKDERAFALSWSTVRAGRAVLYKNNVEQATFTADAGDYKNGKKYTYREDSPNPPSTLYELVVTDQTDPTRCLNARQTVQVLASGWHAMNPPRYGYPAVLVNENEVKLSGIFIDKGHASLCSSAYPYAVWDLENRYVPDQMATSPGVYFGNKLRLVGGSSVAPDICSDRVYTYDGETGRWQEQQAGWPARMGHACVVFHKRLWVIGGMDSDGNALADVHSMDANGRWQEHTDEAPWAPRCMLAATVYNEKLWIYGGCEQPFGDTREDMWTSSDGDRWTPYAVLPELPGHHAIGQPLSNALQVVKGELNLIGSFRTGSTVRAQRCVFNEAQQSWLVTGVAPSWDQQGQNTHSLIAVTFNGLVFLRSLNYQIDDNQTRLYLCVP